MKTISFFLLSIFVSSLFVSCKKDEPTKENPIIITDTTPQIQYSIDTIGHEGFDFSEGMYDSINYMNNDGEVLNWHSGWGATTYAQWAENLWFRNSQIDTVNWNSQIKNYGETSIDSISSISEDWDSIVDPLLPGYVFGAKCFDGYLLFEVLEIDTLNWRATFKYRFNATNEF